MNRISGQAISYGVQGLCCHHVYKGREGRQPVAPVICVSIDCLTSETVVIGCDESEVPIVRVDGYEIRDADKRRLQNCLAILARHWGLSTQSFSVHSRNSFPMGWGLGSSASGFSAAIKALASAAGTDPLDPVAFRLIVDHASFSAPFSLLGGVAVYDDKDDSFTVMENTILEDLSVFIVAISPLHPRGDLEASARHSMLAPVVSKDGRVLGQRLIESLRSDEFAKLAQMGEATIFLKLSSLLCSEKSVCLWEPKTIEILHAMNDLRAGDYGRLFVSANSGPSLFVYSNGYDEDIAKVLESLNVTYRRGKLHTSRLGRIRITLGRHQEIP